MKPNMRTKIIRTSLMIILMATVISPLTSSMTAYAQSTGVPIDTNQDQQSVWQHIKLQYLDPLAWQVAKIAVQKITADTVQWINSGFQGSPAFLTNPEQYFQNVADQATGAFIQQLGLSNLCSPFSVDVRLAIALGQVGGYGNQYSCTLSTIINNAQNASINGMSIQGFMGGDFSQGGWPAFIALSQPNNNESGTYLQAHSDLMQHIGGKQANLSAQLLQGNGFLSWQSCNDIVGSKATQYDPNSYQAYASGQSNSSLYSSDGTGQAFVTPANPYGSTDPATGAMQTCQTETPGSVINSQLEKQLGSGIDQLNLANSFNEIVSALMSQLVTQVLTNGLSSATQKPSGVTQSYVDQLQLQANGTSNLPASSQVAAGSFAPYISQANQVVDTYQQIVALFANVSSDYAAAQACYQGKISSTTSSTNKGLLGRGQQNTSAAQQSAVTAALATIQSSFNSTVAVAQATYQTKLQQATAEAASTQAASDAAMNAQNTGDLQTASNGLSDFVSNELPVIQQNSTTAQADLTVAQADAAQFDTQAKTYLQNCQSGK